jgi:signal peptidase I
LKEYTYNKEYTYQIEEKQLIQQDQDNEKVTLKSIFHELLKLGIIAIIAFVIASQFTVYIGQYTKVHGISMESTIDDKDYLFIDKLTYRYENPARFDIIVFPYSTGVYYIKRIIGLPGETVQIIGETIYIDGKPLDERYGKELMKDPGDAAEPIKLLEDEYFVLGDNRNDSTDSRSSDVGTIVKNRIIGKAVFRLWPLNKLGKIE